MDIRELILKIINDLDYYKKTSKFVYTLENIEKKIMGTNTILREILEKFIKESANLDEQKTKEISVIINKYLEASKKKYINKLSTTDYDIYEYDEMFKCFIRNKKIDIKILLDITFTNKVIDRVIIDGILRTFNPWDEIFINDLHNADKIEIWIRK